VVSGVDITILSLHLSVHTLQITEKIMSDVKHECDVCESTENVECEIFMSGNIIDRIYHFCPGCQVKLFRKCIDDLIGQNEYKVSEFIQRYADDLICRSFHERKMDHIDTEEVDLIEAFDPIRVRKTKPYDDEDINE